MLCPTNLYLVDHFTITETGELQELQPNANSSSSSSSSTATTSSSNYRVRVQPLFDGLKGISASLEIVQPNKATSKKKEKKKRSRVETETEDGEWDGGEREEDDENAYQKIALKDLREIHKRRYQLQNVGIELFLRWMIDCFLVLIDMFVLISIVSDVVVVTLGCCLFVCLFVCLFTI